MAKKPGEKKTAKKALAKRAAARSATAVKKAPAKKAPAKKPAAKKTAAKKTAAKKTAAKKTAAKKTPASQKAPKKVEIAKRATARQLPVQKKKRDTDRTLERKRRKSTEKLDIEVPVEATVAPLDGGERRTSRTARLISAVTAGDAAGVSSAVADGADPARVDLEEGCTPLELAAGLGQVEAVRALLDAGAPVDTGLVQSPLGAAASQGHLHVMEALLAAGAAIDAPGEDALTPLMTAASAGQVEAVELLLGAGADPNKLSAPGDSALALAALSGDERVFDLLAPRTGDEERARAGKLLDEHKDRERSRKFQKSALSDRADASLPLISTELAARGATGVRLAPGAFTVEFPWGGEDGDLLAAAELGYEGIVAALLREGTMPDDAELLSGHTPLMRAAAAGQMGTARILLAAGASAAARDAAGNTSLHHAVALPAASAGRRDRAEIASELLARGASPSAQNEQGETPLHLAVRWGYVEVARALLRAGASPGAASRSGETPRQLATGHGELEPLLS